MGGQLLLPRPTYIVTTIYVGLASTKQKLGKKEKRDIFKKIKALGFEHPKSTIGVQKACATARGFIQSVKVFKIPDFGYPSKCITEIRIFNMDQNDTKRTNPSRFIRGIF